GGLRSRGVVRGPRLELPLSSLRGLVRRLVARAALDLHGGAAARRQAARRARDVARPPGTRRPPSSVSGVRSVTSAGRRAVRYTASHSFAASNSGYLAPKP